MANKHEAAKHIKALIADYEATITQLKTTLVLINDENSGVMPKGDVPGASHVNGYSSSRVKTKRKYKKSKKSMASIIRGILESYPKNKEFTGHDIEKLIVSGDYEIKAKTNVRSRVSSELTKLKHNKEITCVHHGVGNEPHVYIRASHEN